MLTNYKYTHTLKYNEYIFWSFSVENDFWPCYPDSNCAHTLLQLSRNHRNHHHQTPLKLFSSSQPVALILPTVKSSSTRQRARIRSSSSIAAPSPLLTLNRKCTEPTQQCNALKHSHIEIHRQRLKCKAVPSWGWGGEVWEPVTLCARQYVAIQCSTVGAMSWGQSIRVSAMIRQQPPTPAPTSNNHLFLHHCHPPHPRPKFNTKAA